jgi:hypothetical protein
MTTWLKGESTGKAGKTSGTFKHGELQNAKQSQNGGRQSQDVKVKSNASKFFVPKQSIFLVFF